MTQRKRMPKKLYVVNEGSVEEAVFFWSKKEAKEYAADSRGPGGAKVVEYARSLPEVK